MLKISNEQKNKGQKILIEKQALVMMQSLNQVLKEFSVKIM